MNHIYFIFVAVIILIMSGCKPSAKNSSNVAANRRNCISRANADEDSFFLKDGKKTKKKKVDANEVLENDSLSSSQECEDEGGGSLNQDNSLVCADRFPNESSPPGDINFEKVKSENFYQRIVAELVSCVLDRKDCDTSKKNIERIAGAVGTATDKIRQRFNGNDSGFIEALAGDGMLAGTLYENAPCLSQQEGGVVGFQRKYASAISNLLQKAYQSDGGMNSRNRNNIGFDSNSGNQNNPNEPDGNASVNAGSSQPVEEPKACAYILPGGQVPAASELNFDKNKTNDFYLRTMALLTPCMLLPDRCEESKTWVTNLASAIGPVTQRIKFNAQGSKTRFFRNLKTNAELQSIVAEYAECVKYQPGGIQAFIDGYADRIASWME